MDSRSSSLVPISRYSPSRSIRSNNKSLSLSVAGKQKCSPDRAFAEFDSTFHPRGLPSTREGSREGHESVSSRVNFRERRKKERSRAGYWRIFLSLSLARARACITICDCTGEQCARESAIVPFLTAFIRLLRDQSDRRFALEPNQSICIPLFLLLFFSFPRRAWHDRYAIDVTLSFLFRFLNQRDDSFASSEFK